MGDGASSTTLCFSICITWAGNINISCLGSCSTFSVINGQLCGVITRGIVGVLLRGVAGTVVYNVVCVSVVIYVKVADKSVTVGIRNTPAEGYSKGCSSAVGTNSKGVYLRRLIKLKLSRAG